jgi:hypothetical protein
MVAREFEYERLYKPFKLIRSIFVLSMDSSGFNMEEVYPSNGGLPLTTNPEETNPEETLQFEDFRSEILQSADEIAYLSMNSVDENLGSAVYLSDI